MAESSHPLHRLVWSNQYQDLESAIQSGEYDKEEKDPRGRTPLMLAVTLGHLESIRVLLRHGTNVNVINQGGWTVVQEAVATGDPELLQIVLERRDHQRYASRIGGIPELLLKLKSAPDFYVEMKWEFTSWIPFVSRMCPSDTYKVYKQGSNVRIDTTLLGFDQSNWVRGNRTYIFSGRENGADLYEIDHDTKTVYCEEMKLLSTDDLESFTHTEDQISARLTTPLVLTYLDTDKINFERSKGGFWGWGGSEKFETVSGYNCKVFGANNVELITKTRTEHLTEDDKKRAKSNKNPLQSFLGMAEEEVKLVKPTAAAMSSESFSANNPCCITPDEYFGSEDLKNRDIGRPKQQSRKVQKFQAHLWLSEDYPLSLQEQVMPIVDLMAISNSHFQKLKDFITCSFPAGFPVKIEIPLFHVVNAQITFMNIFGLAETVEGVSVIEENSAGEEPRTSCYVNDSVFEIPSNYSRIGGQSSNQVRRQYGDDDDQLLQYALRQSVSDRNLIGGRESTIAKEEVDIWEALQAQAPVSSSNGFVQGKSAVSFEDKQLELQIQKAIELSLGIQQPNDGAGAFNKENDQEVVEGEFVNTGLSGNDLAKAIEISKKEEAEKRKKEEEEDEVLKKILELSKVEK